MKRFLFILISVVSIVICPFATNAALIFVTSGDLIGSRSTPEASGVIGNYGYTPDNGGFKISWDITDAGAYWSYSYSFSNANDTQLAPALSHWLLEVSPVITSDNYLGYIWDTNFDLVAPKTWDPEDAGEPQLPVDLYGIKLDSGQTTYTFKSTQPPVWGDFYGKCGGGTPNATAWNASIGIDPAEGATSFTNWIPTPDTESVPPVPIPGAVWLLGSGLVGLVALKRKFIQ